MWVIYLCMAIRAAEFLMVPDHKLSNTQFPSKSETTPERTSKDDVECTTFTTMESLKSLIEKIECVRRTKTPCQRRLLFSSDKKKNSCQKKKKEKKNPQMAKKLKPKKIKLKNKIKSPSPKTEKELKFIRLAQLNIRSIDETSRIRTFGED